jgi:hypothetical protein
MAYGLLEGHFYKSVNLQHEILIASNESGYNLGRKNLGDKAVYVMLSCQLSMRCVSCFKGSQGQAVHEE